jgi:hypothetical protein
MAELAWRVITPGHYEAEGEVLNYQIHRLGTARWGASWRNAAVQVQDWHPLPDSGALYMAKKVCQKHEDLRAPTKEARRLSFAASADSGPHLVREVLFLHQLLATHDEDRVALIDALLKWKDQR